MSDLGYFKNIMKTILSMFFILMCLLSAWAYESKEQTNEQNQIGMEFSLRKDLLLKGVKLDLRSKAPDYLVLLGSPGIEGPEIFDLGRLPVGSRIRMVGLIEKRGLLRKVREYEAVILSPSNAGQSRVRVSATYAFNLYEKAVSSRAAPRLNQDYFAVQEASEAEAKTEPKTSGH